MIDTNILLDWLLDRDPLRTKLIDKLLLANRKIHIADLAIAELVFALEKYYKLSRDIIAINISRILDEDAFICNRSLFQRVTAEYVKRHSLSFIDCCLIYYAELNNTLPLWTSDRKLANQSSNRAKLLA